MSALNRDQTHIDFIKRWAREIKEDKKGNWRNSHADFINSQYDLTYSFIKRLKKQEGGLERIKKIYNIKNENGYKKLLYSKN